MSPLIKALFKVILIWATGQSYLSITGFQLGDLHPNFGHSGQVVHATRITPKLQENLLNKNNLGQESCRL